jgi:hypothetical protein
LSPSGGRAGDAKDWQGRISALRELQAFLRDTPADESLLTSLRCGEKLSQPRARRRASCLAPARSGPLWSRFRAPVTPLTSFLAARPAFRAQRHQGGREAGGPIGRLAQRSDA